MASTDFVLSCSLGGHQAPVRAVATGDSDVLVTAETTGYMRSWTRKAGDASREFDEKAVSEFPIHGDNRLLFALEAVRGQVGTFVSGGNDNKARVWNVGGDALQILEGHSNAVNSVSQTNKGYFVTGSFDGTARVWKDGRSIELPGEHKYGVEVCALETGEIVTGSFKVIHIIKFGKVTKTIREAHNHVIRRIVRHPLGFASCANDGFVRVWSNAGDLLSSINAHPVVGETASFVYSIAVLPSGELVSVGEDSACRIWEQGGALKQEIRHPSPIRCVTVLPNGDILTGADVTARIFTCDPSRRAPDELVAAYQELLDNVMTDDSSPSGVQSMDPSKYPGPEALDKPGAKDGEMKVVNMPDGLSVHSWSAAERKWNYIGQAMGQAQGGGGGGGNDFAAGAAPNRRPRKKVMLNGVEYDHVSHIYVTAERQVSLGFNVDDDPMEVAINFCMRHSVDRSSVSEIIAHITPYLDPIARQQRVAREEEAARRSLKHIPSWKRAGMEVSTNVKADAMRKKILEINEELKAENHYAAVTSPNDIAVLEQVLALVANQASYHVDTEISGAQKQMILRVLSWPTKVALPALDMVRILMCHSGAVKSLWDNEELHKYIFNHATSEDAKPTHVMLISRLVGNWVAKRPRTDAERGGEAVDAEATKFPSGVIKAAAKLACQDAKSLLAFVQMLHNLVQWLGKFSAEYDVLDQASAFLLELLQPGRDYSDKILYFSIMTLGTLAHISETRCASVASANAAQLRVLATHCRKSSNRFLQELAVDLQRVFGFSL